MGFGYYTVNVVGGKRATFASARPILESASSAVARTLRIASLVVDEAEIKPDLPNLPVSAKMMRWHHC